MAGGLGILGYAGLAPEASGGVAVAPTYFDMLQSEELNGNYDRYQLYNIIGALAPADDRAGVLRVAGDINTALHPLTGGNWLKQAFGDATDAEVTSGTLWSHTWKTAAESQWDSRFALPPYTIELFRDVGSAQVYAGCQTNEFALSIAPNDVLRSRSSIIGVTQTNKAASVASFHPATDQFDYNTASFSIEGVANADVEAFEVTFGNALEGIPTLSGRNTVYKIRRSGSPTVAFTMTLGFENITEFKRFIDQSEISIALNMMAGNSYSLLLQLPRCIYSAFPLGMGGGGRQTVDIEGMARYHQGSGTAFDLQIVNSVGSY